MDPGKEKKPFQHSSLAGGTRRIDAARSLMPSRPSNSMPLTLLVSGFICLASMSATLSGQSPDRSPAKPNPLLAHRIEFEEARRLVNGEDEGNLTRQIDRFTRTRLRSGQVIEIYYPLTVNGRGTRHRVSGYGMLYPSEAAYREATRPRHMLEELIPDGRAFLEQVPQLVGRLEKRLRLAPGRLEMSRAGLRRVDIFLRQHHANHTTAQTDPRLFQELTAYYGESLRRARQGQWKIREELVGETHRQTEPNIVTASGVELKPWSSVIRALYDEDNRGFGLARAFDNEQP